MQPHGEAGLGALVGPGHPGVLSLQAWRVREGFSTQPPGATARVGHAELRGSSQWLFSAWSLLARVTPGGLGVTKCQWGRWGYPHGVHHGATWTHTCCQRCPQQPRKRQTKPAGAALPSRSPHPALLAATPPQRHRTLQALPQFLLL